MASIILVSKGVSQEQYWIKILDATTKLMKPPIHGPYTRTVVLACLCDLGLAEVQAGDLIMAVELDGEQGVRWDVPEGFKFD